MSSEKFFEAVRNRRSFYAISKEKVVSEDKVQSVLEEAIKYSPSPFNSQSARVVVLFNEQSDKLWDMTLETLRVVTGGGEGFDATEGRMAAYKAGYGTILYFEDQNVVSSLQEQFPTYHDKFPIWSTESNAMLQYVVWTALELEGLRRTPALQPAYRRAGSEGMEHSCELEADCANAFRQAGAPAGEKTFLPLEDRFKVIK